MTEPIEDQEFRAELRAWLEGALTDELRASTALAAGDPRKTEASREWQRLLHEGGWIAIAFPRGWGGREATPTQVAVFHEETALARAPNPINAIGIWNIGPMLLTFGTEEQKNAWIPPMLSGEQIWCQGFSEPDAGSDLAALRTRADRTDDGFIVNGQKVWTSNGDIAALCLALVRTDPDARKHQGISALVIDMRAPGVEVRPIREITGDYGFNEVFFTDVAVPAGNLVGTLHDGWNAAMSTLTHERMGTTALGIQLRRQFDDLVALARTVGRYDDPLVRDALVRIGIEVELTRTLALRAMAKLRGGEAPTTEVALGKLQWAELCQRMAELAFDIQGPTAVLTAGADDVADDGRWQQALLWSRMTTIGAGTTEIQKNILARRGLGLPKG